MSKQKDKNSMSFLEHLGELRWHLMRSVLAVLLFSVLAFLLPIFDEIFLAVKEPDFPTYRFFCWLSGLMGGSVFCFEEVPIQVMNTKMAGQFQMHLWMSFVSGLILAFPYVFWEIWRFIQPGLRQNEKKSSRGVIFFTTLLFLSGVLFGYYIISPLSIQFLGTYQLSAEIANMIDMSNYINLISSVTLATGLLFQLPIVVYFLSRLSIVTPDLLKKYRRHAIVIILSISAIITPPDITSQVLVTVPVVLLYQLSIFISRRVIKKAKAANE